MTPELPENLFIEALKSVGFSKDDYFSIAEKFTPEKLRFYLELAFTVGYEKAYEIAKKESHGSKAKQVISINEFGNGSVPFHSVSDAAKSLKVNERNIRKAIKSGKKCGGYYWKYA